ncbi:MAG: hypothetical protein JRC68_03620 [Deltaproteobacteria bacterium]|nr:hypothetical protein [Deltaproteobacteria bacterium]
MTNIIEKERDFEKKSSAVTLSDMEVFIFPELMFSLVLANIMSPNIWRWRDDPWFKGIESLKPYRRITRLKQYIMNNYVFNLDLETWGLTTKEKEMARFDRFIDQSTLAESNALFGYAGDKYYFDVDIRTHFGLQDYDNDVIPYWKTETVEAMDAFSFKPKYSTGAGECVSLATLYAAALFIVARIPLKEIYLMATPLHSQNYIDVDDGLLTNNRRLVTKNMWFNGTALSAQARRALENEKVTIVAHETGYIHTVYNESTIDPELYKAFCKKLRNYLSRPLSIELLSNFFRHTRSLQKCFQLRRKVHGQDRFIGLETVYSYEHGNPYRMNDNTRDKLLDEIEMSEFKQGILPGRMVLNNLEDYVQNNSLDLTNPEDKKRLQAQFMPGCEDTPSIIDAIINFSSVNPRLPDPSSVSFISSEEPLEIDNDMDRDDIIQRLENIRDKNDMAKMAFYAYRDLRHTEAEPFVLAAIERNPVSFEGSLGMEIREIKKELDRMPDSSIYDGVGRLAQPDEVWNYRRGDGIEKALLMANVLHNRRPEIPVFIDIEGEKVVLQVDSDNYEFSTSKGLKEQTWRIPFTS